MPSSTSAFEHSNADPARGERLVLWPRTRAGHAVGGAQLTELDEREPVVRGHVHVVDARLGVGDELRRLHRRVEELLERVDGHARRQVAHVQAPCAPRERGLQRWGGGAAGHVELARGAWRVEMGAWVREGGGMVHSLREGTLRQPAVAATRSSSLAVASPEAVRCPAKLTGLLRPHPQRCCPRRPRPTLHASFSSRLRQPPSRRRGDRDRARASRACGEARASVRVLHTCRVLSAKVAPAVAVTFVAVAVTITVAA
eukprot:7382911-Prymnesium_polylepis.1